MSLTLACGLARPHASASVKRLREKPAQSYDASARMRGF